MRSKPRLLFVCALALMVGLGLTAALPVGQAQTAALPNYPLRLSTDGRYLVDENNRPFFMNGDSAWSLIAQLSKEDAALYLEDRPQKGLNVVLAQLVKHQFSSHAAANFYNTQPFTTAGNFNTPNEAYFAHADWVISDAAAKGILVLLDPLYLGSGCGSEGWCAEVKNSSTATMRNWGNYVGTRYKKFSNGQPTASPASSKLS
jgi:Protein of unknown function (DUF4038)